MDLNLLKMWLAALVENDKEVMIIILMLIAAKPAVRVWRRTINPRPKRGGRPR